MGFQPLIFNGFLVGQSSGGGSSPTIGGPVVGGTANSVLFVGAGSTLAQDNTNFNFNDSTHALTITGVLSALNVSGSNTGDVTLGTTNGLSLAGQVLSLQLSSTSTTGALNSTDWNTFNNKQPAGSYVLTSSVGAANGVASLDGAGKVPVAQLPAAVMEYEGAWNPSTNTPTLSDGTGTNGNVYYVTALFAGPIAGLTDPSMHNFQIGDLVIYSSSVGKWQLTTPAAGVQSVNGLQGVVVLTQGNLTDAGTDGITVTNGTNAVWGSGTSFSQHVADTTHNGYLASTDWNTFNNKQASGNYITQLHGDGTATGPGNVVFTLTATSNSTLTTLSALSLPGSQVTGNISGNAANITATTNSSLDTLPNLTTAPSLNNVGAIVAGYWEAGIIDPAFGGTGTSTYGTQYGVVYYALPSEMASTGAGTAGQVLTSNGTSAPTFQNASGGTVSSVSVVSANGFAGTVATSTTTPAITISTSITGVLKGNGTAISAASAGTDYVIPSGSITGTASNITATSNATLTTLASLSLPASQLSGTTLPSSIVTSSLTSLGAQSQALNMNSHLINNVTDPVSAQDAATKNYVDNAVQGLNPALAVQAATTSAANTSSFTYNNGVGGIGATFTGPTNTTLTVDGYTFTALGQRLLVKNDTQSPSGAFNGIYYVTQLQTALLPLILTRALDYDQPSDINNTGAIPVINGTVNGTTQWVETALVNTIGTDPLTFALFSNNPANNLLAANNLSDVASKSTTFNNINPMTTTGDIIYEVSAGVAGRLPIGSAGQILTVSSGIPSWQTFTNGFKFYASSQITTLSSAVTATSFTTFSNSPAFTFTPTITGTYKVYSNASLNNNTPGSVGNARIFNTTGGATLLYESQGTSFVNPTATLLITSFIQSVYTLTASTSYVFDIQGQTVPTGNLKLDGIDCPFYMFAELCG